MSSAWIRGLLFALCLSCGDGARKLEEPGRGSALSSERASAHFELADYQLASAADISFVSLGLRADPSGRPKLVLYDVRESLRRRPETRRAIWRSEAPMLDKGVFVLSHFDAGNYNRLGGSFSAVALAPSTAALELLPDYGGLEFRYRGRAGFWIHLFDDRVAPEDRTYLHPGAAGFISFQVRGSRGGEELAVRIADRSREAKDESILLGGLDSYLEEGALKTQWQRALIPLSALPALIEQEELASLIFTALDADEGRIFLRDLALVASPQATVPGPASGPRTQPKAAAPSPSRALRVLDTERILASEEESAALVRVCGEEQIGEVFLQVLAAPEGASREAQHIAPMLPLVEGLHRVGARVWAIDEDPPLALAENHRDALDTVRAVITSNESEPAERRFDGIRFSGSPERVPGFAGPARESILRGYLQLLGNMRALCRGAKLALGADIPAWFDARDGAGELRVELDHRPLSELVLDRVDNLAIALDGSGVYGADGLIAQSLGEIEYAERTSKSVYLALQTSPAGDERLVDFGIEGGAEALLLETQGTRGRATLFAAEELALAEAQAARSRSSRILRAGFGSESAKTGRSPARAALDSTLQRIADELRARASMRGFVVPSERSLRAHPERSSP